MNNLKAFDLNIGTVMMRFYLMMAVVIVAGFSGYWLIALLALPIFLSTIMGISFTKNNKEMSLENNSKKYSSLLSASKVNLPNVA
ncbi:MAG: hypothetical protein AB8F94_13300 [Saprospiraceae bacterium]